MNYTVYNPATGEILYNFTSNDPDNVSLNLQGKSYVPGIYNGNTHMIHQGQVIDKPQDPSTEQQHYDFDWSTQQWILNQDKTSAKVRLQRDIALEQIDKINPIWYESLNQSQQQELKTYRQALLDVPQQAGFPTEVEWPAKPAWL